MKTRAEHLAWCKERALHELDVVGDGDPRGNAVAAMLSDLGKWSGGEMYPEPTMKFLGQLGIIELLHGGDVRRWIEGFN